MKKNPYSFKLNMNPESKATSSLRKNKSLDKNTIFDNKNNTSRTTTECDSKFQAEHKSNILINSDQKQKVAQCLSQKYESKKSIEKKRLEENQFQNKLQFQQPTRQMINTQQMSNIKRQKSPYKSKQFLSISNNMKTSSLNQQQESNQIKQTLLQTKKLTNTHRQTKSTSSPLRKNIQQQQQPQQQVQKMTLQLQKQKTLDFQKQFNLSPISKVFQQPEKVKFQQQRFQKTNENSTQYLSQKILQRFQFNEQSDDSEVDSDQLDLQNIDLEFNLTDMTASMSELKKQLSHQKENDYSFSSFTNHSLTAPKQSQKKCSNEYDQILGDIYSAESFECEDKSVGNEYNQIEESLDKKLKATQLLASSSFQNDINIYYSLENELTQKNLDKCLIEKKLHQEFLRNQLQKKNEMPIASAFLIEYNPKNKIQQNGNSTVSIIVLDKINELVSQENLASPILMSSGFKECNISRRFSEMPNELNLNSLDNDCYQNKDKQDEIKPSIKKNQPKKPLFKLNNYSKQTSIVLDKQKSNDECSIF